LTGPAATAERHVHHAQNIRRPWWSE